MHRERERFKIGRRSALLLPLGVAGCSIFDDLFSEQKDVLPGAREPVLASGRGLGVAEASGNLRVILPQASQNEAWPQDGGNPAHFMGHLAATERLAHVWRVSIGVGGGFRKKILAAPIVVDGVVYAMDSSAVVSAFEIGNGRRRWRADTKANDDDSTNVGGGLAAAGGTLFAVNGLAELVAFDAARGTERWRKSIGSPARSAPMVVENRLFVITMDDKLLSLAADDGRQLWSYQAATSATSLLGQPSPAYSDGLVVAGFGSGELVALRAETGGVAWTDSLASARGRNNVGNISSIRGLPVIADGRLYAVGLGGLLVALDLRSGRRLWERQISGENTPWAAGDWLFVTSAEQQIAAIRRQDGSIAWVSDLPRWKNEKKQVDPIFWFGPVLAGDRLIVAGTNEEALAISPYSGEVLGRQQLSGPASLGPVVASGTVLIVMQDGDILALR